MFQIKKFKFKFSVVQILDFLIFIFRNAVFKFLNLLIVFKKINGTKDSNPLVVNSILNMVFMTIQKNRLS